MRVEIFGCRGKAFAPFHKNRTNLVSELAKKLKNEKKGFSVAFICLGYKIRMLR